MADVELVIPEFVSLEGHPDVSESWLQDRLAENPELLGLGDLVVRDRERSQPGGGRLDLLLEDMESSVRYEVELQLGALDESHIIRAIEYWDIERRRYPQYEHIAVIVAEDVTSRFLNVISLFNGSIPLIAIRLQGIRVNGVFSLVATRVVDVVQLGIVDTDPGTVVDRAYWQGKSSSDCLQVMDDVLGMIGKIHPGVTPRYNKYYIGLEYAGQARNFVSFNPRKSSRLVVCFKIAQDAQLTDDLEDKGLSLLNYDKYFGQYQVRVGRDDLAHHREVLQYLIRRARDEYSKN